MSLPPILLGAMILSFGASFSVGGLCIFHICLIAKNSSTIEMGGRSVSFIYCYGYKEKYIISEPI